MNLHCAGGRPRYLMIVTGTGENVSTLPATLPRTTRATPVRPWDFHHDEVGAAAARGLHDLFGRAAALRDLGMQGHAGRLRQRTDAVECRGGPALGIGLVLLNPGVVGRANTLVGKGLQHEDRLQCGARELGQRNSALGSGEREVGSVGGQQDLLYMASCRHAISRRDLFFSNGDVMLLSRG